MTKELQPCNVPVFTDVPDYAEFARETMDKIIEACAIPKDSRFGRTVFFVGTPKAERNPFYDEWMRPRREV